MTVLSAMQRGKVSMILQRAVSDLQAEGVDLPTSAAIFLAQAVGLIEHGFGADMAREWLRMQVEEDHSASVHPFCRD